MIRQHLDPTLAGTLQHKWMSKHNNIKPEIAWKQFRLRWAPGFEGLFDLGLQNQWYDPINILQKFVFHWLAIPFIQRELDAYVVRHNTSAKRANKRTILPHGIPDIIFEYPERFAAEDFKIPVQEDILQAIEERWAPPDHPVFRLVPPTFQVYIQSLYQEIGQPVVQFETFWDVYLHLHAIAQQSLDLHPDVQSLLDDYGELPEAGENQGIPLMAHNHVADFGVNGIPPAAVFEERFERLPVNSEHNDFEDGLRAEQVIEQLDEVDPDATAQPRLVVYSDGEPSDNEL
ncbi:hypothetical protein EW026_g7330 [Hermanssonia centrifuga]|uniref:Uncharacterized protein n=1 Tax=Hermanssonia centrifuga TaxID=98765 RepID=A0A4S4K860_9APHY|nr:hypothetical protein EW026_g7330 [Hermanssonia centrifuga]